MVEDEAFLCLLPRSEGSHKPFAQFDEISSTRIWDEDKFIRLMLHAMQTVEWENFYTMCSCTELHELIINVVKYFIVSKIGSNYVSWLFNICMSDKPWCRLHARHYCSTSFQHSILILDSLTIYLMFLDLVGLWQCTGSILPLSISLLLCISKPWQSTYCFQ